MRASVKVMKFLAMEVLGVVSFVILMALAVAPAAVWEVLS